MSKEIVQPRNVRLCPGLLPQCSGRGRGHLGGEAGCPGRRDDLEPESTFSIQGGFNLVLEAHIASVLGSCALGSGLRPAAWGREGAQGQLPAGQGVPIRRQECASQLCPLKSRTSRLSSLGPFTSLEVGPRGEENCPQLHWPQ